MLEKGAYNYADQISKLETKYISKAVELEVPVDLSTRSMAAILDDCVIKEVFLREAEVWN